MAASLVAVLAVARFFLSAPDGAALDHESVVVFPLLDARGPEHPAGAGEERFEARTRTEVNQVGEGGDKSPRGAGPELEQEPKPEQLKQQQQLLRQCQQLRPCHLLASSSAFVPASE